MYLRFPKCQLTGAPEVTPTPHDAPTFFTGWAVVQGNASTSAKELQFSRMKNYVMESLRRGHVATLGFHGIEMTAPTTVAYNLDLPTFTRIIEWLAAEGIPVIRPRDMPPHNLVGDAGFNHYEVHPWGTSGAHPWGVSPYAVADRWQRVTTGQYSGVACMALTASTAKSTSFEQGISVEPGKKYRVHTLAKANLTAGTVTVEVQPKNLLNEPVGAVIVGNTITSASWADHAFEVTIPAGAAMVTLTVRATGAVGTASVDHVAMMDANIYDPLAI